MPVLLDGLAPLPLEALPEVVLRRERVVPPQVATALEQPLHGHRIEDPTPEHGLALGHVPWEGGLPRGGRRPDLHLLGDGLLGLLVLDPACPEEPEGPLEVRLRFFLLVERNAPRAIANVPRISTRNVLSPQCRVRPEAHGTATANHTSN